jgi:preprotein translocase subunit SecD
MLDYPRWKYTLIVAVLLLAVLFALPTVYGEDPALQIARRDHNPVSVETETAVEHELRTDDVQFIKTYLDGGRLMVRFPNVSEQLKGRDALSAKYNTDYIVALSFAPRTPALLRHLGLDLRGGLYLLYQVDVQSAVDQLLQGYDQDIRRALSSANIPFSDAAMVKANGSTGNNAVRVDLAPGADVGAARALIAKTVPDFDVSVVSLPSGTAVLGVLPPAKIRQRDDYAIEQNLTTLRNRVNALGVSEPIVERQGLDRINVQLPGIENAAEVKDIVGKVATLEFRLEDTTDNPYEAAQTGRVPPGAELFYQKSNGQPVLLKRDIIATGNELTTANYANTQEGPTVNVRLDAAAGDRMLEVTRENLGRPMAVVYIEKRHETEKIDGKPVSREVTDAKVISVATIQGVFSNTFMITGMTSGDAQELALLLRSGSLAAPVYPVEEQVVGPSLGQDNIDMGTDALIIGMLGVFVFMAIYYRVFGLIADAVLLANVVVLAALLAMIGTALSLPGIAGIILTVGMAVDANVLIYERIREELRNGVTPQAAIRAGFDKAFSAIADSNVTTLIAGVVLWILGTGPIRGFAVVLTLGIGTSMFTALMGSRALVTLLYGGRRKIARLPI